MKVIWSDTAKLHWSKTLDFIAKNFGVSAVETFMKKTMEAIKQISAMPDSGPVCLEHNSSVVTDELENRTPIASIDADGKCDEFCQLRVNS